LFHQVLFTRLSEAETAREIPPLLSKTARHLAKIVENWPKLVENRRKSLD